MSDEGDVANDAASDGTDAGDDRARGGRTALVTEPVTRPQRPTGKRTRQRYRLTEKGSDLLPALVALMQWGDRWENDGGGVELRHQGCGAKVGVELRCADGHALDAGDTELAARRRHRAAS